MNSIYNILKEVTFKTDYDFFKRDYERDKASIEKAFWMTVIASIYPGQIFNFKTLFKHYVNLLYDWPALELRLYENLAKHLSQLAYGTTDHEVTDLRQLTANGRYIEQELKDVLLEIRASLSEDESTNISVETRHNYQPYLPSPDQIMYFYRKFTQGTPEPKKLTFSRVTEISIHELNQIRKKANSYFPYFLLHLALDKFSDADDFGKKKIVARNIVGGASDAVSTELSKYPWESQLSDAQLHHIIFHNYCTVEEQDDASKINLLGTSAIYKAIRRFRGEEN